MISHSGKRISNQNSAVCPSIAPFRYTKKITTADLGIYAVPYNSGLMPYKNTADRPTSINTVSTVVNLKILKQPTYVMLFGEATDTTKNYAHFFYSTAGSKLLDFRLWPAGWAPYGYKRGSHKDNKLYIDHEKALVVKDIFTMYASDQYTTRSILFKYKSQLAKSKILSILHDPVYIGKINYADKIFPGQHERIISDELFHLVQDKLPQKKSSARPKSYSYPFLLTGLIHCHCGCRLTPGTAKSGKYAYYTCTDIVCRRRISAPKVEQAVFDHMKSNRNRYDSKIITAIIEEVKKRSQDEFQIKQPQLLEYKELQKKLNHDKKNIVDKLLFTDNLNHYLVEELNSRIEQIEKTLLTLQSQIEAIMSLNSSYDDEYYRAGIDFLKE